MSRMACSTPSLRGFSTIGRECHSAMRNPEIEGDYAPAVTGGSARPSALRGRLRIVMEFMTAALGFAGGVVYGSFFEWALHRYVMHRPILFLRYPFQAHALTHHAIFGSGPDYHLRHAEHAGKVRMAWWNGPVLLLINAPIAGFVSWSAGSAWAGGGFMAAVAVYYALYESLHWCMHVPRRRWFQSWRSFRRIDRHHRLHHLRSDRNLNVVLPLADAVLGTFISRAPDQDIQQR